MALKQFHLVVHGYFAIPRYYFHEYNYNRSEVKKVARDFISICILVLENVALSDVTENHCTTGYTILLLSL